MGVGCVLLIVGSAALQIVGLGLVARDLWRVQHQTFGTPAWVQRLRGRLRQLLGRQRTHTAQVSLGSAVEVDSALRLRVRRGASDDTLDARVRALEANLAELEKDTDARFAELDHHLAEAHRRADEVRAHVDQLHRELEAARREELRETLPWQWIGTGLFAVGALLAMWSDLAC